MKPLCLPSCCPVCKSGLIKYFGQDDKCSDPECCSYFTVISNDGDLMLISVRIENIEVRWDFEYNSRETFVSLRKPFDPDSKYYHSFMKLPYFWVDLNDIPALEKKIQMLLTFS